MTYIYVYRVVGFENSTDFANPVHFAFRNNPTRYVNGAVYEMYDDMLTWKTRTRCGSKR